MNSNLQAYSGLMMVTEDRNAAAGRNLQFLDGLRRRPARLLLRAAGAERAGDRADAAVTSISRSSSAASARSARLLLAGHRQRRGADAHGQPLRPVRAARRLSMRRQGSVVRDQRRRRRAMARARQGAGSIRPGRPMRALRHSPAAFAHHDEIDGHIESWTETLCLRSRSSSACAPPACRPSTCAAWTKSMARKACSILRPARTSRRC